MRPVGQAGNVRIPFVSLVSFSSYELSSVSRKSFIWSKGAFILSTFLLSGLRERGL